MSMELAAVELIAQKLPGQQVPFLMKKLPQGHYHNCDYTTSG